MAKTKVRKHAAKQRSITAKLMRGIVTILFLTVLIPVGAYYSLPEWVYYLAPGTRLWIAMDDISNAYGTDAFNETLGEVEKRFDSNIEIYTADGRFIYSTAAMTDPLPADLKSAYGGRPVQADLSDGGRQDLRRQPGFFAAHLCQHPYGYPVPRHV